MYRVTIANSFSVLYVETKDDVKKLRAEFKALGIRIQATKI